MISLDVCDSLPLSSVHAQDSSSQVGWARRLSRSCRDFELTRVFATGYGLIVFTTPTAHTNKPMHKPYHAIFELIPFRLTNLKSVAAYTLFIGTILLSLPASSTHSEQHPGRYLSPSSARCSLKGVCR
jgi:hypothetical protein